MFEVFESLIAELLIFLSILTVYSLVGYSRLFWKTFIMVVLCFQFYYLFQYFLRYIAFPYIAHASIYCLILESIIGYSTFVHILFKGTYDMPSDEIDDDNFVYFIFKRPRKWFPLLTSVYGDPFSSVSVIAGGHWYCFRKKFTEIGFQKLDKKTFIHRFERDKNKYVVVKTKFIANKERIEELDFLKNKPYALYSSNCVLILRPFLKKLNINILWSDFLPSFAIRKIRSSLQA